MATKRRSFRLNRLDAEVVEFALLYFIHSFNEDSETLFKAYKESAEKLSKKLANYEWEVK